MTVIHWFRRDLRLSDNLALQAALASGNTVIPLFIFDPVILNSPRSGAPRRSFMLQALISLDKELWAYGGKLLTMYGAPTMILPNVVQTTKASALYFNKDYTPYACRRDTAVKKALLIPIHTFDDALLISPDEIRKKDDNPYKIYTPFMKQWRTLPKPEIARYLLTPESFQKADATVQLPLPSLPSFDDLGFRETIPLPRATTEAAQKHLNEFATKQIYTYTANRNNLLQQPIGGESGGSSYLSHYLRFGLLSPRQAYWAACDAYENAENPTTQESVSRWISQLIWREFYMHILYHFPYVVRHNFRRTYDALPWRYAPQEVEIWKDGQTGYPIVDAAMRQLKAIGWMPNRARMIVASFLTKDLMIDWREGEMHFMQWLIDGDPAANNGGWQWAAGTGTDAQPYFRIFNPTAQSRKFDPNGEYIRYWVPELKDTPTQFIHEPWLMFSPPSTYPPPLVDHKLARKRALSAFKVVKESHDKK